MISAEELSKNYLDWCSKNINFTDVSANVVKIDVPFLDSFNDEIAIYAVNDPYTGSITLTDDGWTINNLESRGVYLKHSKKRQQLFQRQISNYGVVENDDALQITTTPDNFPISKHRLLQAMLFVDNMFMLATKNTTNLFLEDLQNFFNEHKIRTTQGVSFVGNSGLTHKFEFSISGFSPERIPTRLIKTLTASSNSQVFAQSILTDITQTRPVQTGLTEYYVFINDVHDDTLVKVSPQILSLFEQNDIKAVKYSDRDSVVEELAR